MEIFVPKKSMDTYPEHERRWAQLAEFRLDGSERIVVSLEAAGGTHASKARYLTDAGAASVAFRADIAARNHHFARTIPDFLISHLSC